MGDLKKKYGWSKDVENYLLEVEKTIPKGTFCILKKGGKEYWYFNKSSGKNRLIHLCSVENKGGESNSFRNSMNILKEKSKGTVKIRSISLYDVITEYIEELRDEGKSQRFGTERTKKTTQDIIYHLNKFREYVKINPIKIKDCSKSEFKDYFFQYVEFLSTKYKPNTTRRHVSSIKLFLNNLVEPRMGKPVIPEHPITPIFIKRNFNFKKQYDPKDNFYNEKIYNDLFSLCGKKVREVWISFLENGMESVKSSDVVYFTSLLQLNYGFRIGELIECFVSEETKNRYYKGKGGYSFLQKDERTGNYWFNIYMKKKYGEVYVDYLVYSWEKPPKDILYRRLPKEERRSEPYVTNIVDVMLILFSNSKTIVSTERTDFFREFKNIIINEEKYKDRGVHKTHDLRDMCINYLIHTKSIPLVDVSELTRHRVSTLETHYLHRSKEISVDKSKKLKTMNRLSEVLRSSKKD